MGYCLHDTHSPIDLFQETRLFFRKRGCALPRSAFVGWRVDDLTHVSQRLAMGLLANPEQLETYKTPQCPNLGDPLGNGLVHRIPTLIQP